MSAGQGRMWKEAAVMLYKVGWPTVTVFSCREGLRKKLKARRPEYESGAPAAAPSLSCYTNRYGVRLSASLSLAIRYAQRRITEASCRQYKCTWTVCVERVVLHLRNPF